MFFVVSISYADRFEEREEMVKNSIRKSVKTREGLNGEITSKRDPASLKSNFDEFEKLMNDQEEKDWIIEVDQLTIE